MEGQLTDYRIDLKVTLTPSERYHLINLIRAGLTVSGSSPEQVASGKQLLTILGVTP